MGELVYSMISSLDGFVADEDGRFDWAEPDEQVHRFINDLQRGAGTLLMGRRVYQTMLPWETMLEQRDQPAHIYDFARIWRDSDKVVYSNSLQTVPTARTRLERTFDAEEVRALKASVERDVSIAGPNLAAQAISAGLVDEYRIFLAPIVVGGGTRLLPLGMRVPLKLAEERRFGNGMVYLRYLAGE